MFKKKIENTIKMEDKIEKNIKDEDSKELSEQQKKKAIKFSQWLERFYSEEEVRKIGKLKDKLFNKSALKEVWDKVEILWKKLISKETPLKVKIAIFGGLAYLVLPADILPDVIPGIGYIDDVAVLLYIWKTVMPYIKEVAAEYIDKVTSNKIQAIITDTYKNTILRAVIILLVNICATLISCLRPFGEVPSYVVAAFLFSGALIYTFVRMIKWIVKNGKITWEISVSILRTKSVRKGIADYVRSSDEKVFRQVTRVFKFADIANQMSDLDLPSLEDVIHHYVKKYLNSILLFFGLYSVYVIIVYWLLKPILLQYYANLTTFQILFYPVAHFFLYS